MAVYLARSVSMEPYCSSFSFGGRPRSSAGSESSSSGSSDVDNRTAVSCESLCIFADRAECADDGHAFLKFRSPAQALNESDLPGLRRVESSSSGDDSFVFVSMMDVTAKSCRVAEDFFSREGMCNVKTNSCAQINVELEAITGQTATSDQSNEINTKLSPSVHDSLRSVNADNDDNPRVDNPCVVHSAVDSVRDRQISSPDSLSVSVLSDDEWNVVYVPTQSEGAKHPAGDNASKNEVDASQFKPNVIESDNQELGCQADSTSESSAIMILNRTEECLSIAEPCDDEQKPGVELYKFVLSKKLNDHKFTDCVRMTHANSRKRRNVGRTRYERKWKTVSQSDELLSNFDFSLFPHRARQMTTDPEESAFMDAQFEALEASFQQGRDAVTSDREKKSNPLTAASTTTSPKILMQIVSEHIEKPASFQSSRKGQVSVPENSQSQTNSDDRIKSADELRNKQPSKTKIEQNLYYVDMRPSALATYEDRLLQGHSSHSLSLDRLFDLQDRGAVVPLRNKKKWRTEKARIQVKTKHCRSIGNTAHGRTYYAHHRVTKTMVMCVVASRYATTQQLSTRRIDRTKGKPLSFRPVVPPKEINKPFARPPPPVAPVPRYAMNCNNADAALSADLINVLISMQDRDLSPEDYELLLRLDERVAPKTIEASQLHGLRTDIVGKETEDMENCLRDVVCTICMELYENGQERKYLPCGHGFHSGCIDSWLMTASINCPLDGQEVQL